MKKLFENKDKDLFEFIIYLLFERALFGRTPALDVLFPKSQPKTIPIIQKSSSLQTSTTKWNIRGFF